MSGKALAAGKSRNEPAASALPLTYIQQSNENTLSSSATIIEKPQRWDQPLDPELSDDIASKLIQIEPFASMDEAAFSN